MFVWLQCTPNPLPVPCPAITITLKNGPGFLSAKAVRRCILSFSASSRSVWIHPWSLFMDLKEERCLFMAAIIPGTPATVSRKMILVSHFFSSSVLNHLPHVYPEKISHSVRKHWTQKYAAYVCVWNECRKKERNSICDRQLPFALLHFFFINICTSSPYVVQ